MKKKLIDLNHFSNSQGEQVLHVPDFFFYFKFKGLITLLLMEEKGVLACLDRHRSLSSLSWQQNPNPLWQLRYDDRPTRNPSSFLPVLRYPTRRTWRNYFAEKDGEF